MAKKEKPSDLSQGVGVFLACTLIAALIFAAVVLPILLIPTVIIGVVVYAWYHNPGRYEAKAREKTEMLYNLVKPPEVDVDRNLLRALTDATDEARGDYLLIGRALYKLDGAGNVPPMPAICNSIDGARYCDALNKIGGTTADREHEILGAISSLLAITYSDRPATKETVVRMVNFVASKKDLLREIHGYFEEAFPKGVQDDCLEVLDGTLFMDALMVNKPVEQIEIPESLRTQHMVVVAGTGHGKSQLFQSMILDDLDSGAAIVVIDSQNDLINRLATRVDPSRLVLIDPEHRPVALNIFAKPPRGEADVAMAIELLEYAFSALDAGMTSKQGMVYRYLCRLMFRIPGASIHTMRQLLEPDGPAQFQQYIDGMGETARSFFAEFQRSKQNQYAETRQEVLRRLLTVLESQVFEDMLGAADMRLDINQALDEGKVILISTAKRHLRQTGASLLGRLFIAQVMQAVMGREKHRRRTYLYLDEFGTDYAEDSPVLFNLFEQSRKYELGMVVALQQLAQLPPKLAATIATNTAIKFAGNVSPGDARALAAQMRAKPEFIEEAKVGTFAAYFRDKGTTYYPVEFGRLERTPERDNLADIRDRMKELYGTRPAEILEPEMAEAEPDHAPIAAEAPKAPDPPKRRTFNVDDQ